MSGKFWVGMPLLVGSWVSLTACSVESRIVGSWDIASVRMVRAQVADAVANDPGSHVETEATAEEFGTIEFFDGDSGTLTPLRSPDTVGVQFVDLGTDPIPYTIAFWAVIPGDENPSGVEWWERNCGMPYAWADDELGLATDYLTFNRTWAVEAAGGGLNLRSYEVIDWSPAQRDCWIWEMELR
jgi:hypothetical protein